MASVSEGQSIAGKKLAELRVVDLRLQLEKRGIEKTGVKAALIERLKKAIEGEGENAEEYLFEVSLSETKKTKPVGGESNEEDEDDDMEVIDEAAIKEDPIPNGDASSECLEVKPSEGSKVTDEQVSEVKVEGTEEAVLEVTSSMEVQEVIEETEDTVEDELMEGDFVELIDADTNFSVDDDVLDNPDGSTEKLDGDKSIIEAATMDKTDEEPSGTQISSLISGSSDDISTKESCAEKGAASPANVVAGDNNPVPLTKENLEVLEGSSERKNEDDISLIVHVDESVNDLDNDILDTPTKDSNESSTTEKTDEDASKESCGNQPEAASTSPAAATKNKEQSQDKSKEDAETKPEDISLDASKATAVKQPASSSGSGEKSTESAEKKEEEKSDAKKPASTNSRNLWVSGLSSSTKATDLKTLFSKHGKVAGAKVVTNARSPGARCYGFITMSSPDEASKCIQHLHRTELHGRMISVERAKNDPSAQSKLAAAKKPEGSGKPLGAASSGPAKPGDKKEIGHPGEKKDDQGSAKKDDRRDLDRRDRPRSGPVRRHSGDMRGCRARPYRHGDHPSRDHARHPNDRRHPPPAPRAHSRHGSQQKNEPPAIKKDTPVKKDPVKKETPVKKEGEGDSGSAPAVETEKSADEEAKNKEEMLDFEKIKEERERERQKQRERERREEEKRKARLLEKERLRQREIERRQREEARRLERERERLRSEKARLEEERLEAERQRIMLERERQQRERERLEREREEERRMDALRKREENQRRAAKRTFDSRGPRDDYGGWNEPKRPTVTEPSRGDRGAENRGGEPYQRRVERYNRRDGRPIEGGPAGPPAETTGSRFSRRDERRDESHRHDAPSTRVSRRETSGPRQARGSSNEQHDSGVKYGRDRYEDRSDRRNESGVPAMSSRDGDRRDSTRDRHERRAPPSPHHTSRSSPPHRSQDSRAEWKDSRGSNSLSTNRDVRESGGRYGGVSTQDMNQSTSWHGSRGTMSVSAVEERNKPRGSYNPGPGILGTVPSTVDQWQRAPPERSAAVSSHPQPVHTRPPPERAWAPVTAAPVERVPRQVAASPIINPGQVLHVPPTSSGFLASAANIMMSVGLAGNRSAQDVRYDAYKPVSGNIRRY